MARGTVSAANGAKPMRELQINLLASEMRDEVEHAEPYGFTSEPHTDGLPEAFALFLTETGRTASSFALQTGAIGLRALIQAKWQSMTILAKRYS